MIEIVHQPYDFKIKETEGRQYIFDTIRKKYIVLTPEEWVRQHIIRYLVEVLKYPQSLISIEKKITFNNLTKRYDVVVFDRAMKPWMLVECKAPHIELNEATLHQLFTYQKVLQTPYGLITNGPQTYCCNLDLEQFQWLEALPQFEV